MKTILGCILLSAFWFHPLALAQVSHGTIGVMYYSQDKIIMAADSRVLVIRDSIGKRVPPDDTACKITALDNQIVFIAANITSHQEARISPVEPWTAIGDIREVYKALSVTGQKRTWVGAVANKWGEVESKRLLTLYEFEPSLVIDSVRNGVLTVAFIGGIDVPGYLIAFQVEVGFDKTKTPPIQYQVSPVWCASRIGPYCGIGNPDVVEEYRNLRSQKAVMEMFSWLSGKAFSKTFGPEDIDIIKAIRLVDLTIGRHKEIADDKSVADVGGKIDALELTRDGKVRWFARKENCE